MIYWPEHDKRRNNPAKSTLFSFTSSSVYFPTYSESYFSPVRARID